MLKFSFLIMGYLELYWGLHKRKILIALVCITGITASYLQFIALPKVQKINIGLEERLKNYTVQQELFETKIQHQYSEIANKEYRYRILLQPGRTNQANGEFFTDVLRYRNQINRLLQLLYFEGRIASNMILDIAKTHTHYFSSPDTEAYQTLLEFNTLTVKLNKHEKDLKSFSSKLDNFIHMPSDSKSSKSLAYLKDSLKLIQEMYGTNVLFLKYPDKNNLDFFDKFHNSIEKINSIYRAIAKNYDNQVSTSVNNINHKYFILTALSIILGIFWGIELAKREPEAFM